MNSINSTWRSAAIGAFVGLLFGAANAAEAEKNLYAEIDGKIQASLAQKTMPDESKQEILSFWAAFQTFHKANPIEELAHEEIVMGPRRFPIELKDKRPCVLIEGHTLPLTIKGKLHIFTTGDVVTRPDNKEDYTLEVYVLVPEEGGFMPSPMTLAEVLAALKS